MAEILSNKLCFESQILIGVEFMAPYISCYTRI